MTKVPNMQLPPIDERPLFERHVYCRSCQQHIWIRAPADVYVDALCCKCDARFVQRGKCQPATRWMGDGPLHGASAGAIEQWHRIENGEATDEPMVWR